MTRSTKNVFLKQTLLFSKLCVCSQFSPILHFGIVFLFSLKLPQMFPENCLYSFLVKCNQLIFEFEMMVNIYSYIW